jgi:hypothetical protein
MIIRKLIIIIMGIFLVICAGSCNIYPLYLKVMMDKFQLTLKEVNLYGSSINLGLWVAFPMGWIYDRYGPKISCIIGAISLSGTYLILYGIMRSSLTYLSIFPLLLLGLIMGQGSALCYTCSVTTNLKNFRFKESSCIVGLIVANLAISPSIFTTYREYLTDIQISNYFLIIAIFLAVIITLCGFVFQNIRRVYSEKENLKAYEKYKEKKYIKVFILINIITLIIYTFGVIFNNLVSDTKFPNVVVYPCLQLLNFVTVILEYFNLFDKFFFKEFIEKEIRKELNITDLQAAEINQNSVKASQRDKSKIMKENGEATNKESPIRHEKENSLQIEKKDAKSNYVSEKSADSKQFQEIELNEKPKEESKDKEKEFDLKVINESNSQPPTKTPLVKKELLETESDVPPIDFYEAIKSRKIIVMFCMLVLGIGSMIANLNNIEFIVKSIAFNLSPSEIFEFIILYFAFNSFFRIISGIILDKLIKAKRFYHFFICMSFIGFLSQFLGMLMEKNFLFLSISLAGATHGGYMTFVPVYVRTEFGTLHMGKILGILTTGCAVGSLLVADVVFTVFYEVYMVDGKCFGKRCYYPAYIISTFFLAINCVLSFYFKKLHDKKKKVDVREIRNDIVVQQN